MRITFKVPVCLPFLKIVFAFSYFLIKLHNGTLRMLVAIIHKDEIKKYFQLTWQIFISIIIFMRLDHLQ